MNVNDVTAARYGLLCSALRIVSVAAITAVAFLRLSPEEFVLFSQAHVALSFAGFIECLAAIERSQLYAPGSEGERERAALLGAGKYGLVVAGLGLAMTPIWPIAAACVVGVAVASLSLTESAALRDDRLGAARWELSTLACVAVTVLALAVVPKIELWAAALALNLASCAPRCALALKAPAPWVKLSPKWVWSPVVRNRRSLMQFVGLQMTLPWIAGATYFGVPKLFSPKEASWVLMALRASGIATSLLGRVRVTWWIDIAARDRRRGSHGGAANWLLGGAVVLFAVGAWALVDTWVVVAFAIVLSLTSVALANISVQMNAAGRFLAQVPYYALFWIGGLVSAWALQLFASHSVSLVTFATLHLAWGGVAVFAMWQSFNQYRNGVIQQQ